MFHEQLHSHIDVQEIGLHRVLLYVNYRPPHKVLCHYFYLHFLPQGARFFLTMSLEGARLKVYSTISIAILGTLISQSVTHTQRVVIMDATFPVMPAMMNMD